MSPTKDDFADRAVKNFQEYLRIKTVHPHPNYGVFIIVFWEKAQPIIYIFWILYFVYFFFIQNAANAAGDFTYSDLAGLSVGGC